MKIHWIAEGLSEPACGKVQTQHRNADDFGKVRENHRCRKCNKKYQEHLNGFLAKDFIWRDERRDSGDGYLYTMVIECKYVDSKYSKYNQIKFKGVKFTEDYSRFEPITRIINLYQGEAYRKRAFKASVAQKQYVRQFLKLMTY
jgi:hypothetical protein